MVQRILMIILILIVVLGGGFFAYKELMPPVDEETQGPVYSTKEVIRGDISVGVETTGTLDPSRGGAIRVGGERGSSFQAVIDEYLVEEGDEVKKGQVLVKLKSSSLESDIEQKKEELEARKEQLEELTGMPYEQAIRSNFSKGITLAAPLTGRVTSLEIPDDNEIDIGQTIARVVDDSKYIVEAELFDAEYKKVEEGQKVVLRFPYFDDLIEATITKINHNKIPYKPSDEFATGFVYQVLIEGDNTGLVQRDMEVKVGLRGERENEIQYFANKGVVKEFIKEEKVTSTASGVITEVHVDAMEAVEKGDPIVTVSGKDVNEKIEGDIDKIREIERELRELESQFDMLEVKAPMDGIVAAFYREEGENVGAGEYIGSLYTVSDMMIWAEVDDIDVLNVQQGAEVDVTVDALPNDTFKGEVMHVSTMGKSDSGVPMFGVEIRVEGNAKLRPGMQAKAYIKAGEAKDILLVPIEGIFEEDGKNNVEILREDGTTEIVPVKLGLMNERVAEVKSGVKEGDLIVTGSSYDLLPSQHIQSENGLLPSNSSDAGNQQDNKQDGK